MAASSLTVALARDIRPAIDLVDGLRACGVDRDIAVPQVIVVGDQSSGKSSVVEAVCGVPLPRGAGLTTRCATELHLSDGDGRAEWRASIATSVDPTPVRIGAPEELADAVSARTEALTDSRRAGGFSKERIIVHITHPDLPHLTLIDLPGLIRTKTYNHFLPPIPFMDNSQDKSAVAEVRDLVQSYMVQERTIILVVVPSTQDVATVEALEWAARYDPSGQRTIGCMTKPDLVDIGAEDETIAVLTNQRKPLTLGYVMLRNRNQREVSEGILNLEARRREAAFFEASPAFSDVDRSLLGVEQLVAKLTSVLVSRIYAALPSMRNEIVRKLDRATAELDELGTGAGSTDSEAGVTLMRIVFEYHSLLQDTCQGRYVDKRLWSPKTRLCTRAQALYDKFKAEVVSTRPDFDNTVVDLVEAEIRESRGRELPGFLNPRIFESRVARFVEDWRAASARLITALRKMIVEVTSELLASLAPEFPALRLRMRDLVGEAIRQVEEDGRREVGSVFSRETEGVFTMNDQFLNEVNARRLARFDQAVIVALARAGRDSRSNSREKDVATLIRGWYQEHYCAGVTERTRADAEDMVVMLSVYWDVASRRFVDSHVMALDGSMIRILPERAYVPLNAMVLESSGKATGADHLSVAQLLREDEATMTKRKTLIERKSRLEKARELVDKF